MCKLDTSKYFTIEMQELFVHALQADGIKNDTVRDALYIQLMTGMRPGEVVALRWQDVDFEGAAVTVAHTVRRTKGPHSQLVIGDTKSRNKREVPLPSEALDILKARRLATVTVDLSIPNLIFANRRGGLIEPNGLNRYLQQCCAKMQELAPTGVDVPKFTAHSLRHTFATRALEVGVPTPVVADWLGHSSVRITGDVYSHNHKKCSQKWGREMEQKIWF